MATVVSTPCYAHIAHHADDSASRHQNPVAMGPDMVQFAKELQDAVKGLADLAAMFADGKDLPDREVIR